jgi:4-hydroxyphenylpyruvate dioxygenase
MVIISRGPQLLAGSADAWIGDLLILGCVLGWGIYSLFSKELNQSLGPVQTVTYSILLGTLMLLMATAICGELSVAALLSLGPQQWLPMGLMGFEFVEFASPTPGVLEPIFEKLGFTKVAVHRSKDVVLYRQGEINFIVNNEPKSAAAYFAAEHGPSACGMAFRVKDAHKAYARALELGAQPLEIPTGPMELRLPAIKGIGGAPLYLIDRFEDGKSIYDIDFEFIEGVERNPKGHGLQDHRPPDPQRLPRPHVLLGRLLREAVQLPRDPLLRHPGRVHRPDLEGDDRAGRQDPHSAERGIEGGGGQIEEFLMKFNGEGIQHIALLTDDIFATVDGLRAAGVPLMTAPPETYYEMLEGRLPGHGEDAARTEGARPAGGRQGRRRRTSACCCRSSRKPSWARCSSSSSSARATTALAKATSRRCSSRWSAISPATSPRGYRSPAVCARRNRSDTRRTPARLPRKIRRPDTPR